MEVQHVVDQARNLGNRSFKAKRYGGECPDPSLLLKRTRLMGSKEISGAAEAITYYSDAIELSKDDATLYRNRSAAHSALLTQKEALADAHRAVSLKPTWAKGLFRYTSISIQ